MSLLPHELELLAPARDVEIGRQAILHGADAVYLGGPVFGARANAANSVADIAKLVEFAHRYHARIFTTINTILHDAELEEARKLVWQLYDAGVDALIIQDMGLLEMDLPPIQLHASTQCDIRTVEKAKFLADSGFSQRSDCQLRRFEGWFACAPQSRPRLGHGFEQRKCRTPNWPVADLDRVDGRRCAKGLAA